MTGSQAQLRRKSKAHEESFDRPRKAAEEPKSKLSGSYGKVIIGLVIFVVFGSAVVQILRAAQHASWMNSNEASTQ